MSNIFRFSHLLFRKAKEAEVKFLSKFSKPIKSLPFRDAAVGANLEGKDGSTRVLAFQHSLKTFTFFINIMIIDGLKYSLRISEYEKLLL